MRIASNGLVQAMLDGNRPSRQFRRLGQKHVGARKPPLAFRPVAPEHPNRRQAIGSRGSYVHGAVTDHARHQDGASSAEISKLLLFTHADITATDKLKMPTDAE